MFWQCLVMWYFSGYMPLTPAIPCGQHNTFFYFTVSLQIHYHLALKYISSPFACLSIIYTYTHRESVHLHSWCERINFLQQCEIFFSPCEAIRNVLVGKHHGTPSGKIWNTESLNNTTSVTLGESTGEMTCLLNQAAIMGFWP